MPLSGLDQLFAIREQQTAPNVIDNVAVVEVIGPLEHHAGGLFDSYDSIKERVKAALSSSASCVLLSIDSGGGLVAGLHDTVTELRALSTAAGKPIYCYVDSEACSAAYILACAADRIWVPPTAMVGSVGLIECLVDVTALDAAQGVQFHVLTSGARKADTNPHTAKNAEALGAKQAELDALAEEFFKLVATYRPITVDQIRDLQAGVVYGANAVNAGLADDIGTFDSVVALLNTNPSFEAARASTNGETMSTLSEYKQALIALVEDEKTDPKDKDEAEAMLKACGWSHKAEEEPENKNEEHKEPDGDEKKAFRAQTAKVESLEKTVLLMSRTDFTDAQKAELMKQPLAVVKYAVENQPTTTNVKAALLEQPAVAALNTRPSIRGDAQPHLSYGIPEEQERAIKIRLGLLNEQVKPHLEHKAIVLPTMTDQQREQYLAARKTA